MTLGPIPGADGAEPLGADADGPDAADAADAAETQAELVRTAYADLVLPVTGDPRVDDAAARLAELADLPVDEHLAVYQDVHRRLHDTLAELDSGGASPR